MNAYQPGEGVDVAQLTKEIRQARASLEKGGAVVHKRLDGHDEDLRELYLRTGRLGSAGSGGSDLTTKEARDWLIQKHWLNSPSEIGQQYESSPREIADATRARKAISKLFGTCDVSSLSADYRKSLSQFSFGSNQFALPPTLSNRVLSCLVDCTDVSALLRNESIATASIR
jgi:hypothetical protein